MKTICYKSFYCVFVGLSDVSEALTWRNGTFLVRHHSGSSTLVDAEAKHPLLELSLPVEAEMFPLWSRQTTTRGSVVNKMAWTYSLVGDAGTSQQTIHRQLWVRLAYSTHLSII